MKEGVVKLKTISKVAQKKTTSTSPQTFWKWKLPLLILWMKFLYVNCLQQTKILPLHI